MDTPITSAPADAQSDSEAAPESQEIQASGLDFDSIEEVISTARRTAQEDFRRHLAALVEAELAKDEVAIQRAKDELQRSAQAAEVADRAQRQFLGARSSFRATAVSLAQGEPAWQAQSLATATATSMEAVGGSLAAYADQAPQSRFFQSAVQAVAAADRAIGAASEAGRQVGAHMSAQAQGFAAGLKAFAKQVGEFAVELAQLPERILKAVRERSVTTAAATLAVSSAMSSRVQTALVRLQQDAAARLAAGRARAGQAVSAMAAAVQGRVQVARANAWELLDTALEIAESVNEKIQHGVDVVERHAAAVAGVAGDGLRVLGDAYRGHLDTARDAQEARAAERDFASRIAALRESAAAAPAPAQTEEEFRELVQRYGVADNTCKSSDLAPGQFERALAQVEALHEAIEASPFAMDGRGEIVPKGEERLEERMRA